MHDSVVEIGATGLFFCTIWHSIEQHNKAALYCVPLQFSRHEWSVTVGPSIFNIKARGLAQYSLVEITLRQIIQGGVSCCIGTFR